MKIEKIYWGERFFLGIFSCCQGRPEAADGRVADASRAIFRHLALLASSPPRPTKLVQNGGLGLTGVASGSAGLVSHGGLGLGNGGEAELGTPELNRMGFEVSRSCQVSDIVEAARRFYGAVPPDEYGDDYGE